MGDPMSALALAVPDDESVGRARAGGRPGMTSEVRSAEELEVIGSLGLLYTPSRSSRVRAAAWPSPSRVR